MTFSNRYSPDHHSSSHPQPSDQSLLDGGVTLDEAVTWMLADQLGLDGKRLAQSGVDGQRPLKLLRTALRTRDQSRRIELIERTAASLNRLKGSKHAPLQQQIHDRLQMLADSDGGTQRPSTNPTTGLQEFFYNPSLPHSRAKALEREEESRRLGISPIPVTSVRPDVALREDPFADVGQGATIGALSRGATVGILSDMERKRYGREVTSIREIADEFEQSQAREAAKLRSRQDFTPVEMEKILNWVRPPKDDKARIGGNPTKTNARWNSGGKLMGRAGAGMGVLGLATAGADIATAEDPLRAAYANALAGYGGTLGGYALGALGGAAGLTLANAPGAAAGAVAGSTIGSTLGGSLGYKAGEAIYDYGKQVAPYYDDYERKMRWTPKY